MTDTSKTVRIEQDGPVFTVVIDRPHARNAIDGATARALAAAFRAFEADPGARVAVLCGAGGNFCAGADLKALATGQDPCVVQEDGDGPLGPTRMRLEKPVIAAVSGYAVAGGLELSLFCDLRVAEETAVFGAFERRWGVPLIDGGTVRLPRIVGLGRALDMILTGRAVSAREALEIGLVNRIVPEGEARSAAELLARQIASHPQTCMQHDRASTYEQYGLSFEEAMANELRHGMRSIESGEYLEGARVFSAGKGRHGEG